MIYELYVQGKRDLWDLKIKKVYTLKVLQNERFKFSNFGEIPKMIYAKQHFINKRQSFEYETLELYKSFLKPGFTVLDVGANVGLFSLLGSNQVGETGKIYAFEPSADTYAALNNNLRINNSKNVQTFPIALSDSNSKIKLDYPNKIKSNDSTKDLYAYINKDITGAIDAVKLDDFVMDQKIKKVDFIKIDIEGAELLCFKGGSETLKQKPTILFECYEPFCNRFGYSVIDVLKYLDEREFKLTQLNEFQWLATDTTN